MKEENLQNRILNYRAEKNISAKEFARLCRVSTQTIYMIERGLQTPSKLTEAKINKIIGEG